MAKLIYDANGGSNPPMTQVGATTYVVSTGFSVVPAAFKRFVSWATVSSPTGGTTYLPGDSITISSDTTLYARYVDFSTAWEENRTSSISVNGLLSVYQFTTETDTNVSPSRTVITKQLTFDNDLISEAKVDESFDPTGTATSIRTVEITVNMYMGSSVVYDTRAELLEAMYAEYKDKIHVNDRFFLETGYEFEEGIPSVIRGGMYVVTKVTFDNSRDQMIIFGESISSLLNATKYRDRMFYFGEGVTVSEALGEIFRQGGLSTSEYTIPAELDTLDYLIITPLPMETCLEVATKVAASAGYHLRVMSDGRISVDKNPILEGEWNYIFSELSPGVYGFYFGNKVTPNVPFFSPGAGSRTPRYTITADDYTEYVEDKNEDIIKTGIAKSNIAFLPSDITLELTLAKDVTITVPANSPVDDNGYTQVTIEHQCAITVGGLSSSSLSNVTAVTRNPTYGYCPYSTTLDVEVTNPAIESSFVVTLLGSEIVLVEVEEPHYVTEQPDTAQTLNYSNPAVISSEQTRSILRSIVDTYNRKEINLTMRDDPSLDVGDCVFLTGIPFMGDNIYTLVSAKRTFNGAFKAEYTFI